MLQFFLASWRAGFRSRALGGSFVLGLGLVFIAYLSASFSMRQLQTVALDVGLSGMRISLALVSITLVQDLVGREIERRSVVFSLAYPRSRASYLLGRFFGVLALSAVVVLIFSLLLWGAVLASGGQNQQEHRVLLGFPYWLAVAGVWLDAAVITAFSLLVCTLSTISVLPLAAGIAFALAGRAFGPLFEYIAGGANGQPEMAAAYRPFLEVAQWLLPDLSRLDWRVWPLYGLPPVPSDVLIPAFMAACYVAAMLGASVWMFSRREFL